MGICCNKDKKQSPEMNGSDEELIQFSQEIIMTLIVNEPLEESAQQPLEESSQETRRKNNKKSWLEIYGTRTLMDRCGRSRVLARIQFSSVQ
jgi:hypothetical protein